jgi:hypothetical protein
MKTRFLDRKDTVSNPTRLRYSLLENLPYSLIDYDVSLNGLGTTVNKLLTVLRTPVEKGEGSLETKATSYDDRFDSFRLSLMF